MAIDTDKFSDALRKKSINVASAKLLITNFQGTEQEGDLSEPANCKGYGRVRHFRRIGSPGWPLNPLPIDPAGHRLGLSRDDTIRAQVFQNAACNWRCWYCYVPFKLLNADSRFSGWLSAEDLVGLYLAESGKPCVIDLSGGQPDLVPEWIPWMMLELRKRGLENSVYLWSDDNLSNDYFTRYVKDDDKKLIEGYRCYGKVCCFKGFDEKSFAFNTKADPSLFQRQFDLFSQHLTYGIDLYGYVTLTTDDGLNITDRISRFVDRLQGVSPNLPLRVIPLEIREFTPVSGRMGDECRRAVEHQWEAVDRWINELQIRFPQSLRDRPIFEIPL